MSQPGQPASDEPILMIHGDKVGLGPIREDLARTYQRWVNDLRSTRTLALMSLPLSLTAEQAWAESAAKSQDAIFTIHVLDTMQPIGNADLRNIDFENGTAEYGILIGEPDAWGKGYGTETTQLMLAYAFDVLGLHNVMLQVYEDNPRAIRAYERAGFKRIGSRRRSKRIGREFCDEIFMDAIADDFPPSHLHDLMHPNR
jgi:RimJ/RimL family protein N-acetyltransferase